MITLTRYPSERRRRRFAHEFARIERLCAFRDVGQQNIHKRMLAVERRPALVLAVRNSPNRRDIEFAEGVVLRAKKTSPLSIGLSRIDTQLSMTRRLMNASTLFDASQAWSNSPSIL
jgi:hypothetical protein